MPELSGGPVKRDCGGFTLVDMLVSLVVSLVLLGALYGVTLAAASTGRVARATMQMTEDASVAFGILRAQLAPAGYSVPWSVGPDGRLARRRTGLAIKGCDNVFVRPADSIDQLSCRSGSGPDALAIVFQADLRNSLASDGRPLDCLGNRLPDSDGSGNPLYLSYSRLYVEDGGLKCLGPGNSGAQMLVEHVSDLRLLYGVGPDVDAAPSPGDTSSSASRDFTLGRVLYYATAAQVNADGAWGRVLAVRACLVIRSEDEVLAGASQSYSGCDPFGAAVQPADRRLYRAFTTTVLLHNRVGSSL